MLAKGTIDLIPPIFDLQTYRYQERILSEFEKYISHIDQYIW